MKTLMIIPGLGSDAAVWQPTIAALDGRVNCLVGNTHGDNSLPGMARRVLDQAPATFALAGVSMGGMVALEIMRIAPQRVTHLALVDTNARPDTAGQRAYRYLSSAVVAIPGLLGRLSASSARSLVHTSAPPEVRKELAEMGVRVGAKVYIRQSTAVASRKDQRPVLRTISIPTVVVVGSDDRITPLNLSQEIHDLTPGSTFQVLPDCGHLPPIEKPARLAAILLELMMVSSTR
ncbi:MAG: alpha/beta fold hydrolase [Rhodobacteraceae bacterium]|nr:alpha/beta fold hydrolase [Paracoccaceae bacterium]